MLLVLALATVPFSYDGQMQPGQTLTVRDVNGDVRVRAGDRLAIRANKHATHGDPSAVAIHVEHRADGVVVCVRYPPDAARGCGDRAGSHGSSNDNDTVVDFDITVPHRAVLDAQTVNGMVDVTADGPIDVATVNGGIRAEGPDVRSARTVNGSITVRVLAGGSGRITARTVNGSVDVALPAGTGVTVHAKTLTGDIHADGVTVERPRYGPGAHADGVVGDGARRVDLQTLNGSITLHR